MSISEEIIDLLATPQFRYHGIPINILGLPIFHDYKPNSVHSAVSRLKKDGYIIRDGEYYKLVKNETMRLKRRRLSLSHFDSPFIKNAPKNLLLIFDIPETKKPMRDWLRLTLKRFGYTMIQKSVWIGPGPLSKDFENYLKEIHLFSCLKKFNLAKPYTGKS